MKQTKCICSTLLLLLTVGLKANPIQIHTCLLKESEEEYVVPVEFSDQTGLSKLSDDESVIDEESIKLNDDVTLVKGDSTYQEIRVWFDSSDLEASKCFLNVGFSSISLSAALTDYFIKFYEEEVKNCKAVGSLLCSKRLCFPDGTALPLDIQLRILSLLKLEYEKIKSPMNFNYHYRAVRIDKIGYCVNQKKLVLLYTNKDRQKEVTVIRLNDHFLRWLQHDRDKDFEKPKASGLLGWAVKLLPW